MPQWGIANWIGTYRALDSSDNGGCMKNPYLSVALVFLLASCIKSYQTPIAQAPDTASNSTGQNADKKASDKTEPTTCKEECEQRGPFCLVLPASSFAP